ncbi:MAG TPA: tetratricopeptide repeat protein, partial [Pyrinomonadaceae bacterium]|nr:tetratricopeptide repeat protein [Pyrinomonadaceae bacterium]
PVTQVEVAPEPLFATADGNFLNEFRSELGLEEAPPADDDDYETVFHTAVAYREMGLLEDAIRGFQDAVNRVRPSDGTRRFFQCCNLLGLCFVEKGMPNLAIIWYQRAMETPNLSGEESHAMLYELGNSYAAAGEQSRAVECFEQIYAVNVGYRDVSMRLEKLYSPTPH